MSLFDQIVQQLGVSNEQAEGGVALLMKLAKEKLGEEDFSQVSNLIPGLGGAMDKAPEIGAAGEAVDASGGVMEAIGGLAKTLGLGDALEKLGDLQRVAEGFKSLGLDLEMIQKFAAQVLDYLKSEGGEKVMAILKQVLK